MTEKERLYRGYKERDDTMMTSDRLLLLLTEDPINFSIPIDMALVRTAARLFCTKGAGGTKADTLYI